MVVNDGISVFDIIGAWLERRRAAKLARRKAKLAKRKAATRQKVQPQRVTAKRRAKHTKAAIKTARDHRRYYGASPALRVIPGGKA